MKTIKDFRPLLPAEQLLLDACKNGEMAKISNSRPTEKTVDNEIRAEFLRSLILTEKDSIDPKGIWFTGAYVGGKFDYESCETNLPFRFWSSLFEDEIVIMRSKIRLLSLIGSEAKEGINANGLKCEDSIWLGEGFNAKGEVNFNSSTIGSNLTCSNGKFENENGKALVCDKAEIGGDVWLDEGFNAKGEVNFNSSTIGSNLTCRGGIFENENGKALVCDKAEIGGSVWLNEGFNTKGKVDFVATQIASSLICAKAQIDGVFDLDSVKVKDLRDDEIFWSHKGLTSISIDGFVYGHIHNDFQAEKRKKWLDKILEFKPQPYKQLAKVLRDMGHTKDANEIMIAYHDKMRNRNFIDALKSFRLRLFFVYPFVLLFAVVSLVFKFFYGGISGYGYKPMRTFALMVGVFASCGYFYSYAASVAVFAPSNPLVFQKKDYYECNVSDLGTKFGAKESEYNKTNNWTKNENLDGEYTTFEPFWYSLDIILPVVDLQMDKDWGVFIPSKAT